MAIERDSIVRQDFPIVRRGYDRDAVDRHLERLADQIETLSAEAGGPQFASAAGTQVQSILEAAEATAADIRREAEEEAIAIRADARRMRDDAGAEARDHIDEASVATAGIVERIDAVERQLTELADQLRAGAGSVSNELTRLMKHVTGLGAKDEPAAERDVADEDPAVDTAPELELDEPAPEPERPASSPPAAKAKGGESDEAARLVALDLALGGASRDEVDRKLEAEFPDANRAAILDAVYASVNG
jgi:DivIVA domain-containing protein